ncbi:MAG: CmpA/NrtA family ABC transporter substrate-binding protein [Roseicyclus sp.]
MTHFKDPFNPNIDVWNECGEASGGPADPYAGLSAEDADILRRRARQSLNPETGMARALESAVMQGLFRTDISRRAFLRSAGVTGALAAVSTIFPLSSLQLMAEEAMKNLEKTKLTLGFVPITCATPIIGGHALGFYERYGLDVDIVKTAGWAVSRDKCLNGEYDGSHLLFPMPLAMSLGLGSTAQPWRVVSNVNTNGQAIVLANKHRDNQDPANWKGFRFAVPFEYSMHNLLLRDYVAKAGLDPDVDIQIRVTPPPEMVANLRADNVDGYLAPDPFCQRAVYDQVGFIHKLTLDLWKQHPCCVLGLSETFIEENPNTFIALTTAILEATASAETPEGRIAFAESMAPANYLNQPVEILRQILTGVFPDGQGNIRNVPDRISFMPLPTQTMGTWVLSQLRRWNYIEADTDYASLAEELVMTTTTRERMQAMMAADTAIMFSDIDQDVFAPVNVQGLEFSPEAAQEFIDGQPFTRTI